MTDHTLRRTDDLLSELVELIETARTLPMSTSCIVAREHTLDLLDDLRDALPAEMLEARAVIEHREELLTAVAAEAVAGRARATEQADAVLADAAHRAEAMLVEAEQQAAQIVHEAERRHAELVSNTSVHQAAAEAAAAMRQSAEQYHAGRTAEADGYHRDVRADADQYAARARAEADEYAATLVDDTDAYADRTLAELADTLERAASVAHQGRVTLAQRRETAISA